MSGSRPSTPEDVERTEEETDAGGPQNTEGPLATDKRRIPNGCKPAYTPQLMPGKALTIYWPVCRLEERPSVQQPLLAAASRQQQQQARSSSSKQAVAASRQQQQAASSSSKQAVAASRQQQQAASSSSKQAAGAASRQQEQEGGGSGKAAAVTHSGQQQSVKRVAEEGRRGAPLNQTSTLVSWICLSF
ncbi:hypothetical protein Efla_001647 [Eimeria flavescens]